MYNTFPISISVTEETLEQLEGLTVATATNRSKVIRELVAKAWQEHTQPRALTDTRTAYTTKESE